MTCVGLYPVFLPEVLLSTGAGTPCTSAFPLRFLQVECKKWDRMASLFTSHLIALPLSVFSTLDWHSLLSLTCFLAMSGPSQSYSKHGHSLCLISVVNVFKQAFFAVSTHRHCQKKTLPVPVLVRIVFQNPAFLAELC